MTRTALVTGAARGIGGPTAQAGRQPVGALTGVEEAVAQDDARATVDDHRTDRRQTGGERLRAVAVGVDVEAEAA